MPTPLDISDNLSFLYIVAKTQNSILGSQDIAISQADCEEMFKTLVSLMPHGDMWTRDRDSEFGKLLAGYSVELCRVLKAISIVLERESDPRTCVYMLPEWQALVSLSDDFSPDPKARREAVVELLRYRGGSNDAYWIGLTEGLGFTDVSISDPKDPFLMGYFVKNINFPNDYQNHQLKGGAWHYTMNIEAKGGTPETRQSLREAVALRLHATWACTYSFSE